ncbi:N-acetyltransferase [Desulfosporosinus shakirovi]|uniref:N-acetyltransferase n=1 Tax=Desulfosporosinus shakirovi TaxID=2885154 RepID=UPI001E297DE8|nr:N-acetyltransferase [Desulfosporosinus sp. SRJS8]MCB8817211.1 transferase [Desulfosporosinus sp. SRJS8]
MNHNLIAHSATVPITTTVGPFCVIGENVVLGENVILGVGCVLSDEAKVGDGVELGNYVSIGRGAVIGQQTRVGDHTTVYPQAILGEDGFIGSNSSIGRLPKASATSTVKAQADMPALQIGNGFTIGCSAVLYAGTNYADKAFVGDGAVVRERCSIGQNVVIGSGVVVENDTKIGEFTKIQTGSYITAYMEIEERVFIAPMVTTTNDNYMGRTEKRFKEIKGPTIQRGARVGGGSILLPGVKVAPETFVAAGALVSKDTTEKRVIKGFPAKDLRAVPDEELL